MCKFGICLAIVLAIAMMLFMSMHTYSEFGLLWDAWFRLIIMYLGPTYAITFIGVAFLWWLDCRLYAKSH